MVTTNLYELKEKIRKLTSKIEQAHLEGKPPIDSAVHRAVRDIYRKQLLKLQGQKLWKNLKF